MNKIIPSAVISFKLTLELTAKTMKIRKKE